MTSGLLFEAVRKGTKPEEKGAGVWEDGFHRGAWTCPGDFSTDLVLSDWHYSARALLHGREGEALRELRLAERRGGSREIHNLGRVLAESGKAEKALPFFRNSLRVDPGYDLALRNLASALFSLGRYGEGLPCFERVIEFDPENVLCLLGKARGLKARKAWWGAYAGYCEFLRLDPWNEAVRKAAGWPRRGSGKSPSRRRSPKSPAPGAPGEGEGLAQALRHTWRIGGSLARARVPGPARAPR
jgi:tetratricopeptide (TPR) repeat protein